MGMRKAKKMVMMEVKPVTGLTDEWGDPIGGYLVGIFANGRLIQTTDGQGTSKRKVEEYIKWNEDNDGPWCLKGFLREK